MSVLTYNGVTLPYASVSSFNQEPVYDPKGNTDRILTKITITVQSVVNASYLSALSPDLLNAGNPTTTNPATIMAWIRNALMQPRKTLSYTHNGQNLIPLTAQSAGGTANRGTVDAKNGPKPLYCNLAPLTSTTFIVTYAIVGHYWEVNTLESVGGVNAITKNKARVAVLYNRWTETVELDASLYTTKTRDGTYTIRSDNPQGVTVDELRPQMAGLSVPLGFIRVNQRFHESADGLSLDYHIVDREVFRMPPTGAYESEGAYTENTSRNGAYRTANVYVRLRGGKGLAAFNTILGPVPSASPAVFQKFLIQAALGECYGKFRLNGVRFVNSIEGFGVPVSANAILDNSSITVGMYDNTVECRMSARIQMGGILNDWGLNLDAMATGVTTSAIEPVPIYTTRGSAQVLMQAAAYYTPAATSIASQSNAANLVNNTPDLALPSSPSRTEDNLKIGGSKTVLPGQAGKQGE